jgi:hypothetical protein
LPTTEQDFSWARLLNDAINIVQTDRAGRGTTDPEVFVIAAPLLPSGQRLWGLLRS